MARNLKTPRFQQRHYEFIAEVLKKIDRNDEWNKAGVADLLGMAFRADNPKYRHDKFCKACGIE